MPVLSSYLLQAKDWQKRSSSHAISKLSSLHSYKKQNCLSTCKRSEKGQATFPQM